MELPCYVHNRQLSPLLSYNYTESISISTFVAVRLLPLVPNFRLRFRFFTVSHLASYSTIEMDLDASSHDGKCTYSFFSLLAQGLLGEIMHVQESKLTVYSGSANIFIVAKKHGSGRVIFYYYLWINTSH